MSFGAGMSVGMGAGIGSGIAIGVSTGKKQACDQIREQFQMNGLTVHDSAGKEVDLEDVLAPIARRECSNKKVRNVAIVISLLLGLVACGLVLYLFMR